MSMYNYIKTIENCPVNNIKIGTRYQRSLEPARLKKIIQSISENGFWPWETIVVNQDFYVIDGQHRVEAAKRLGINNIRVSVVKCNNEKEEAEVFINLNSFNTRLAPKEFWHGRYQAGHPYANLIYFLENTPASKVYNKIAIKFHDTGSKWGLSTITLLINSIIFNIDHPWNFILDDKLTKNSLSIENGTLLIKINQFFDWFFNVFGDEKSKNPVPFSDKSKYAIIIFFKRLRNTGIFESQEKRDRNYAVNRFKYFIFTPDWNRIGHSARINMLINHWNRNRSKYKIKYDDLY